MWATLKALNFLSKISRTILTIPLKGSICSREYQDKFQTYKHIPQSSIMYTYSYCIPILKLANRLNTRTLQMLVLSWTMDYYKHNNEWHFILLYCWVHTMKNSTDVICCNGAVYLWSKRTNVKINRLYAINTAVQQWSSFTAAYIWLSPVASSL